MRLAVYSHYFLPEIGAPSARIGDFAGEWIRVGHEVHVATCFPNHPTGVLYPGYQARTYGYEKMNEVHVHRCWTYVTPNKGFFKKSMGHASFWPSAGVWGSPHIPKPDCAIGTSPTFFAAMAARSCARRHQIPFIMEVRDLWPAIFVDLGVIKNRAIISLLEKWELSLYRSAARIVTVTEAFRQNLLARGLPPQKVVTITNGADTNYWVAAAEEGTVLRRRLGLGDAVVALYIGAHGISQGLGALLRAAARLKDHTQIKFVFVGEGADKAALETEARRLGLTTILFLDPVDRAGVRAFYAMADLCLVPLRNIPLFDTFIPSKIFEIMAMGKPIVASLRGEAAEILQRGQGAAVVGPEDDEAMAAEVLRLARAPEERAAMGERGRAFVRAHYSRAGLARRYLETVAEARVEFSARA